MNRLEQKLFEKLGERQENDNLRQLTTVRAGVDFYSNDYLGFSTTGLLQQQIKDHGTGNTLTGATGSRLLSGNSKEIEALEQTIASFHGAEAALVFNSGYDANTGLVAALAQRHTTILYDELCHASIIDGVRLSICTGKYKFRHNDLNDLAEKLARNTDKGPVLVLVESVYSMDGDTAPLQPMVDLCECYDAQLIVDEAHATGVFGVRGEGLVAALGLQQRIFARVHTFGKALGCQGAAVVGSSLLRQYLINFARPFIYTTAPSFPAIAAASCAYRLLTHPSFTNQPLHDLIRFFRQEALRYGIEGWKDSLSPIQAFLFPSATDGSTTEKGRIKALSHQLQQAGLQVNAILPPTVAPGKDRLRVCLHTFNTKEQITTLLTLVKQAQVD